ncbi:MAG TPA: M23 family metallopeptidase, partial [Acidimicrobiales bacterium]|nr:M23 family metallopeptidase [Acidimicrobiales bacterium]
PPGPAANAPAPGPAPATTKAPDKAAGEQVVPVDAQAMINSIKRTGGRSTTELWTALRQLVDLGLSPEEAAVIGMGHFPVGGDAAYNDDFLMPRFGPPFHLHQGNDIFGARGLPVRAPEDGIVHFGEDPLGGKAAYVTTADGTYYYMAHLDGYAKEFSNGSRVKTGDVVGYLGDSGNATGSPHVHFEIHPKGGAATNPKPILDRWLDEALANLPTILAGYQIGLPRPVTDAGVLRRFDEPRAGGSDTDLVLSAATTTGSMRLTELRATRGLTIDDARIEKALADAWDAAEHASASVLGPVTPAILDRVLGGHAH